MMRFSRLLLATTLLASPLFAAKPGSAVPPPKPIYSSLYTFINVTDTYSASVSVPQDGAWFYGSATFGGQYMDCNHHYEVDLAPSSLSPDYSPFLQVGYVDGIDTPCVFSNYCYSCSMNFGGFKPKTYFTSSNGPGWLPAGSGLATLRTLNGGSSSDRVSLTLYQVNANDLQSMTVFEPMANDNPAPADQTEIDSRAYIAASDDKLPLVTEFTYGSYGVFPAPLSASFSAMWDTGETAGVQVTNPYGHPGYGILLIDIPKMKTGNHKVTVSATLPSGKTFTASPYQVFVYNAAIEAVVSGTVLPEPVTFTRGDTVTFRVRQQDAKGKTITITRADWQFRNLNPTTPITVNGSDQTGFAADSTEWTGTMVAPGLVQVSLTIQTGKLARTSHKALTAFAYARARTDAQWTTNRSICDDCFDDLAVKNGGHLPQAVVFPSYINYLSTKNFPGQPNGAICLGLTGERVGYESGILDKDDQFALEPHTLLKPLPLYRPLDPKNDPGEWPERFTVSNIMGGPNRTYWYVTSQKYHTEWAYAVNAFIRPGSAPGADPANYTHWKYDPNCGTPTALACYTIESLASCWTSRTSLSFLDAATQKINPNTGQPYDMALLLANVKKHEKGFHWQLALVDYINGKKTTYDIGTILEGLTVVGPNEASVKAFIDKLVLDMNTAYANDPLGGGNERVDPPGDMPYVDDTNGCVLFP